MDLKLTSGEPKTFVISLVCIESNDRAKKVIHPLALLKLLQA